MTEELHILAILKHAEYTGFAIHPYVFKKESLPYLQPVERVTDLNADKIPGLPEIALRILTIANEIEPHALIERFTKQKLSLKDFFEKKKQLVKEVVKPFVDNKLTTIIELLSENSIPLYDAAAMPHLYPTDELSIEKLKARTKLSFNRKEDGTIYTLEVYTGKQKVNLQSPDNYLLTNDPCMLMHQRKIILFEKNISGKLLTPFFSKEYIDIPKRLEKKYFSSFIRKLITNSEIIATGFTVHDLKTDPKAVISLDNGWDGAWCIILHFLYGDKAVLPDYPQKHFTELKTDEDGFTFYRTRRNKNLETEKIRELTAARLLRYNNCFKLPENPGGNSFFDLIDWLSDNLELLEEKGFHIDENTRKKYSLIKPHLIQNVVPENDWFDIKMVLNIEEQQIPFAWLRQNILNNDRVFFLPNGKIFLIPTVWFEKYRSIMVHSETDGANIKLKKFHYKILEGFNLTGIEEIQKEPASNVALPELYNVTLRSYQETGFYWMTQLAGMGFGGILADDMGLGKTLQAITFLTHLYQNEVTNLSPGKAPEEEPDKVILPDNDKVAFRKSETPVQLNLFDIPDKNVPLIPAKKEHHAVKPKAAGLIVMPASLIHNWVNELNRFSPFLRKLVLTGAGRRRSLAYFNNYDVILTTYGTLRNDIEFLSAYKFKCAILDEGQFIKNPSSQTAQSVFNISAGHKFILTGTPVENSLSDLWSQFNFVNPGLLGELSAFNTYYSTPLAKDPMSPLGASLLSMISPFILRRTKDAVAPELPELTETVTYCGMTSEQLSLYEAEKSKIRNQVFEQIEQGKISDTPIMVLKALMKLRQIANHPKMIDKESDAGSGKFEEITDKLETIISENHRVLIFSSFVKHLNLVEEYCIQKGLSYSMLTGKSVNRGKIVSQFKEGDKTSIFLISLKAGGTGLNLTEADYVFMLDPWWNPAAEMQAINRTHRIGQNKSVFAYRFITKDSIEEKIMKLQEKKKALADAFIKPQSLISGMSKDEILRLFE